MAEKTYLELSESAGVAHKFYEVITDGTNVSIRYGRIGTAGRTQVKALPNAAKANAFAQKKISEKVRKGYAEAIIGVRKKRSITRRSSLLIEEPEPAPAPTPTAARGRASAPPPSARDHAPILWKFSGGSQAFGVFVDEKNCWVGNESGHVFCLDKTGHVQQQFKLPDGVKCIVADQDWRYAGCDDGKVYDISGKVPYAAYEISDDVDIYWLDIFDGVLGVSDALGNITVINHEEESQWSAKSPGKFGWMARCDEIGVYHGYKSGVTMYDWEDGSVIWRHKLGGAVLFGWQDEGSVYAGAADHKIYRISKAGARTQTYKCDGMVFSCASSADGRYVFASDNRARVYCFEASGRRLWSLKTTCGAAYSMQYHDDRLYIVTTRGILACIDVREDAIRGARAGKIPIPREFEAPAPSSAESRINHVEDVDASSATGIIVECRKVSGKLRVRAISAPHNTSWNVQFPKTLRVEGARFVVDSLHEASRGGFYRVSGEIKRLKD